MTILAVRYNNPGNVSLPISGWSGGGTIVGAPGQVGYASFPTMAIGFQAFIWRLRTYIEAGRNSIRTIGAIYATDPNWPAAVAGLSGIGIDQKLDPANAAQMQALATGIIKQETGMSLAQLGIPPMSAPTAAPSKESKPMDTASPTTAIFLSLFRNLMQWGGGMLVTDGILTSSQSSDIIGGLLAVGALVWSLVSAHKNATTIATSK